MKPIQLVLIGVALVAALGAGFVMLTMTNKPPQVVEVMTPQFEQVEMERVLVAGEDIPMGTALNAERLAWQEWPKSGVREQFILEVNRPEAISEIATDVARQGFFAGEPIREAKLVRTDSGYMSAILPAGRQAAAVRISAENSVAGFVLPNDYVDVLMTYQNEKEEWITERVLENVRVLAIDQIIEDTEGEGGGTTRLGETATLELTPEQVEVVAVSRAISNGQLTLALRSVEDSGTENGGTASHLLASKTKADGPIKLIRFGSTTSVRNR